jgi:hypothetical protein
MKKARRAAQAFWIGPNRQVFRQVRSHSLIIRGAATQIDTIGIRPLT